jgi:prepilin peptidase CpaA
MSAQVWIAILVGVAATVDDLRRRQIANWIPVVALIGGLAWQVSQSGWRGALDSVLGTAAGFAVFLVFYLLGGMGGGDVKLMAGFGALLGARRLLEASLWTAGIGGLLAVMVLAIRPLWRWAKSHWAMSRWGKVRLRPDGTEPAALLQSGEKSGDKDDSIPYAPAITLGVWLSLVPKG